MGSGEATSPQPADGSAAETGENADFPVPCFFKGVEAGLSGGVLGWVFGFGSRMVMYREGNGFKARLASARMEGGTSARTFATFGGIYAAAMCYARRIRQKEDPINGGVGGCATGLVIGWKGGPLTAIQSCLGIGMVSYYIEKLGLGASSVATAAHVNSTRDIGRAAEEGAWLYSVAQVVLKPAAAVFAPCSLHSSGCEVSLFQPGRPPLPRIAKNWGRHTKSSSRDVPEVPNIPSR